MNLFFNQKKIHPYIKSLPKLSSGPYLRLHLNQHERQVLHQKYEQKIEVLEFKQS